jgi:hypothetical protein
MLKKERSSEARGDFFSSSIVFLFHDAKNMKGIQHNNHAQNC